MKQHGGLVRLTIAYNGETFPAVTSSVTRLVLSRGTESMSPATLSGKSV